MLDLSDMLMYSSTVRQSSLKLATRSNRVFWLPLDLVSSIPSLHSCVKPQMKIGKADRQPAIWTIDTFGRRNLLLFTFPMMAICLFWAGSAFYMDVESPHRVPLIAAGKWFSPWSYVKTLTDSGLRLYGILLPWHGSRSIRVCSDCLNIMRLSKLISRYAAESYPLTHREIGMSFAVQQNNFWSAVLGLTFPSVLSALGPSGTFYLYGGTNLLGKSPHP